MFARSPRRVVLIAFDGVEALDVTGPAGVFSRANGLCDGAYEIVFASPRGGAVQTLCGLALAGTVALSELSGPLDTILVAGGDEAALRKAVTDDGVAAWIADRAASARRVGSVCTGAFIIGAAGLLDGRRATSHWASCARLQAYFPRSRIEPDAIFMIDGPVCTSAGVTAGIDLALALVEADLGRPLAATVAKDLVLFLRRPGGQAQFSATLAAQSRSGARLAELIAWMADNLQGDLTVPALAVRVAMSERTFARRFTSEVGSPPARFVSDLRLQRARDLLEASDWPLERVAETCGLGSVDTLHRLFRQALKTSPAAYRSRFSGPPNG